MGYPLVNLHLFPASAEALRKISHSAGAAPAGDAADAARGPPHRWRSTTPSTGTRRIDEVEFIAQAKVIPVVGQCLDLDGVLHAAYDKIGDSTATRRPASFDPMPPHRVRHGRHQRTARDARERRPLAASTRRRSSSRTTRWCA
jgi:hypothetical protein